MSIVDGLLATIEEINNLDMMLARDIGEHIDSQARTLQALKNEVEAKAFAIHAFSSLPPAKKEQFEKLMQSNPSSTFQTANLPVNRIIWQEANDYCDQLTKVENRVARCRLALCTGCQPRQSGNTPAAPEPRRRIATAIIPRISVSMAGGPVIATAFRSRSAN